MIRDMKRPYSGGTGRKTVDKDDLLPFTTSTTSQLGSMLPICLGWAGFTLPSKINATENTQRAHGMCDVQTCSKDSNVS